ncbi:MAG: CopG family transcriptional regulator [Moraxella sp.]|nr:CopG family transcriptional regulator [Moraxella sp.]
MISPKIKNRLAKSTHVVMRPVHLRLSEEVIKHLEETAAEQGFKAIQGLIRLYIRQGLDRDNANYSLSQDLIFIEKLKRKGVSQRIIEEALLDTNNVCDTQKKSELGDA